MLKNVLKVSNTQFMTSDSFTRPDHLIKLFSYILKYQAYYQIGIMTSLCGLQQYRTIHDLNITHFAQDI